MANSNLTPEQFEILFGDSDVAAASGDTPAPTSPSLRSSLTDEEYMILFGDSMALTADDAALADETADAAKHAEKSQDGFTVWVAPEHSAPQHRAPQHSADALVDEETSYVGTRFSNSIEEIEDHSDTGSDPTATELDPADEPPTKAPIPESVGLVDRMVSKVKQRLSEELGSSEL